MRRSSIINIQHAFTLKRKEDSNSEEGENVDDTTEQLYSEWFPSTEYKQWQIITHNDVSYIVMQDHTSIEGYEPGDDSMLALYMIYRGTEQDGWIEGEYVKRGWIRIYEGISYTCIAEYAGANIATPDTAPSVWS
ncbi:MAG: hypothetical protein R3Y39_08550 [Rikenellaceae bacterium]